MDDYERKRIMDEECRIAKSVDLVYLAKQFGFTPYRSGKLHRMKEDESLVIFDSNTFCHFYHRGEPGYGGSPIDFVETYGNKTTKEAISYLLDIANYKRETIIPADKLSKPKKAKAQQLELPEANDNYKRVFAYLSKTRCIDSKIISQFMHEKRLYESKNKHNCVFVSYDNEGKAKYAALRGTITYGANTTFRGDVTGSDKNLGFPYYRQSSNTVQVFEAPIDMMSFMSLYPDNKDSYVALGCLSLHALDTFLEEHPEIDNIGFILDNDSHAPEIVTAAKIQYSANGYNIVEHELVELLRKEEVKDVNEYLVKMKSAKSQAKTKPNII